MKHANPGTCPLCGQEVVFTSATDNLRDDLGCPGCTERYRHSSVRERGVFRAIALHDLELEQLAVHEIAPSPWGASLRLQQRARSYVASNYWPDRALGEVWDGVHNQNAEAQTYESGSFDLVVHLDVLEHVNHPDRVLSEIARTLRPGGWTIFSTPTYWDIVNSRRVALYTDGGVEHYETPEYHGNPISDAGALVTWRYGYDLPFLIAQWAPTLDTTCLRFNAPGLGLAGYFTEIYACRKARN